MAAKKKQRATLRDVAEFTNVSVMTVSNVVNRKFKLVGEKTRKKVEQAIKTLKYVPSATSRKLRSMREFSIGMIVMDQEPAFLVNPFINQLVAGLSNYLSLNNFSLTVQGASPDSFRGASIFSVAGTDALCAIMCGTETERKKNVSFLLDHHQPIVIFQDTLKAGKSDIAIVNQDDEAGGHLIASHVLKRKAKKLLFIRPSIEWPAIEKREEGVRRAVATKRGSALSVLKCDEATFQGSQAALTEYLEKNAMPDAILGGTDALGIAAMRCCQGQGYVVPDDVMVTGFNGFTACNYSNPSLTTIASPAYEMGQHAAKLILQRLETGRFSSRETLFPVTFKEGGSA